MYSCVFSPFSPTTVFGKQKRALLIQFFLAEFLSIGKICKNPLVIEEIITPIARYFPYDWAYPHGHLTIAQEHSFLFTHAFPHLKPQAMQLQNRLEELRCCLQEKKRTGAQLKKDLKSIFPCIEPFVQDCQEEKGVVYFLLKEQAAIAYIMGKSYLPELLIKIYPKGLRWLEEKLSDHYHERGFLSLVSELKQLIRNVNSAS